MVCIIHTVHVFKRRPGPSYLITCTQNNSNGVSLQRQRAVRSHLRLHQVCIFISSDYHTLIYISVGPPAESYTPQTNNDSLFNVSFDPSFSFGSEAANMEYSILSAILGNPSPPQSTRTPPPPPPQSQFPPWSTDSISLHHNYGQSPSRTYGSSSYNVDSQVSTSPNTTNFMAYPYQVQRSSSDSQDQLQYPQFLPPQSPRQQPQTDLHPLAPRHPEARSPLNNSGVFIRAASPRGLFSPPPSNHSNSPTSTSSIPPGCTELALTRPSSCQSSQLQSIHDRVLTPYDYTQGYHFLMKHLPSRCVLL